MGRLDGKVSLITGAGYRIGLATEHVFAREGAHVRDTSQVSAAELQRLVDGGGARIVR